MVDSRCETITDSGRCLDSTEWVMGSEECPEDRQVCICNYHNDYFIQYGAVTRLV